jgi:hypothetical protein
LQDFSKAIHPVSFFVYAEVSENVDWQDICLDNGQTNERLVVKTIDNNPGDQLILELFGPEKLVLIARYPVAANQAWIEANEQEIVDWNFRKQNRQICFDYSLDGTK